VFLNFTGEESKNGADPSMLKRIGVLSLPGTFRGNKEDGKILRDLPCPAVQVQQKEDLDNIHGLIIEGWDIPVSPSLPEDFGERIKELAKMDFPVFGIGFGILVLGKNPQDKKQSSLAIMDISISKEVSFCKEVAPTEKKEGFLTVPALSKEPIKALFWEKLYIQEIAPNVGILAEYSGKIVFVRQGNMLACAFYPLSPAKEGIYRYFLEIVNGHL